jgi:pyruvate kinase
MLHTKIVGTIGPASREPETLEALIRAAADKVGILADFQGPKLRVGEMAGDGIELVTGEEITL